MVTVTCNPDRQARNKTVMDAATNVDSGSVRWWASRLLIVVRTNTRCCIYWHCYFQTSQHWTHSCGVSWNPAAKHCCTPVLRAQPILQRRSDAYALALGVLFTCVSNNTDNSSNTYRTEGTHPLGSSIHVCGFVDSQHFAILPHCNVVSARVY
jgi:hypothetical protein